MENILAMKPPHAFSTDSFYPVDNFLGKAAKKRKAVRQEKKAERKQNRQTRRQDRRDSNAKARQDRKLLKTQARINKSAEIQPPEESEEQTNFEEVKLKPEQQIKLKNYLTKKRKRTDIEDGSPELLAAQFQEERAREIAQRYQKSLEQHDERAVDNDEEYMEENEPDIEEIEEDILEEEANNFSFTGNEDYFLDPATLAVAGAVAQKGTELYREKRFAKGKKAFGKTKAQYDAKLKAEAEGVPTTGSKLKDAATGEAKKQWVAENTTTVVVVAFVLVSAVVGFIYLAKQGKK